MALRADAQRSRERLLRAAAEVFAERGLAAPVNAIAERAGVTKMTLYRHFRGKDELLYAVMADHFDRQTAAVEELERSLAPSAEETLRTYLRRAGERMAPDRAYFHVALTAGTESDEVRASARRYDEALTRLVSAAQAEGAVRDDVVAGDVHAIMVAVTSHPAWKRYLDVALDGLRPGGSPLDEPAMAFEDYGAYQAELVRRREARA